MYVEEGLALNKYKVLDGSTIMKGNNIFNPKLQFIHSVVNKYKSART